MTGVQWKECNWEAAWGNWADQPESKKCMGEHASSIPSTGWQTWAVKGEQASSSWDENPAQAKCAKGKTGVASARSTGVAPGGGTGKGKGKAGLASSRSTGDAPAISNKTTNWYSAKKQRGGGEAG